MDAFMVDRALLIDRRKSGKRGFEQSRPETGVLKTTLKKRQRYTEALVPPAPQLVPYDEYIAKYERVMKKAGNKVQRIQGRKSVVIPLKQARLGPCAASTATTSSKTTS